MTQSDISNIDQLRYQVRDLAFQLPTGDAGTARLEVLLMGVVQELGHLRGELRELAEEVLGDRRYTITQEPGRQKDEHGDTRPDGGIRPHRQTTIADHHARI